MCRRGEFQSYSTRGSRNSCPSGFHHTAAGQSWPKLRRRNRSNSGQRWSEFGLRRISTNRGRSRPNSVKWSGTAQLRLDVDRGLSSPKSEPLSGCAGQAGNRLTLARRRPQTGRFDRTWVGFGRHRSDLARHRPNLPRLHQIWDARARPTSTKSGPPSSARFAPVKGGHIARSLCSARPQRGGGFCSDACVVEFDNDFFAISPGEAERMSPGQRVVLETGFEVPRRPSPPAHIEARVGRPSGAALGALSGGQADTFSRPCVCLGLGPLHVCR